MNSSTKMFKFVIFVLCVRMNIGIAPNVTNQNSRKVCTSAICAKESAIMKSYLEESVDPCENFYDFACGGFVRNAQLPEDKGVFHSFSQVQDKVNEQLNSILSEQIYPFESSAFKLAKTFHKSCMDYATRETQGITPMLEVLDKYGGWPVIEGDAWNSRQWNWLTAYKKLAEDSVSDTFILDVSIAVDPTNAAKRVLQMDTATFGLDSQFLLKGIENSNVKSYSNFMVDAAVILGADRKTAEHELRDSLQFEMNLAKIALTPEQRRNLSTLYNPYTIAQLDQTFPYMNWFDFIKGVMDRDDITRNENVIVLDYHYVRRLGLILQKTPKKTLANYFGWRMVLLASSFLNDILYERRQQFLAQTTGVIKSPRHIECTKRTLQYLTISVGALYIQRYFDETSKKTTENLVKAIHEEMIRTLQTVPWMDRDTRIEAIQKAKRMQFHIAYPNELADNHKLDQYYKDLVLLPTNTYLQNILLTRKFNDKNYKARLRQLINNTDWESHSLSAYVNAYYLFDENSILLPAAILQERFFSANRPQYMNFAGIGFIIGHEITHAFDDLGRQFDFRGNLIDWWRDETIRNFASKAKCIIDQYSSYTDKNSKLKVNGIHTQGENIADNGAAKIVHAAYQHFVERNGPEEVLPGLNYTPNQLFWISAAQVWCSKTRLQYDIDQYTTDRHAPNKFRITGSFSNNYNFAQDFNCRLGSGMNPYKKCEVW